MRVLVADDNALIRLGLRAALEELDDVEEVAEAADGQQAVDRVQAGDVDVVLLDVRMPVRDGMSALPEIVPHATVLMLTNTDDMEIVGRAMQAGASGYVIHGSLTPEGIGSAIRACLAGGTFTSGLQTWTPVPPSPTARTTPPQGVLSTRESEIMEVVAQGLTNQQIARRLYLSEKTVKNHINRIFAKLQVTSRTQAVAVWLGTADGPSGPGWSGSEIGLRALPGTDRSE